MRKILAFLLAMTMVLSLMVPTAWAAEKEDVTILYTNDIHTYIDQDLNYAKLAAYKKTFTNAILVDAGDHIQGTAYGSMDKGETIIKLMNAAGYDLATLGNHEFDYGMDGRIKVTDEWASPSPSPPLPTSRMPTVTTSTASPAAPTARLCTILCRRPLTPLLPRLTS